MVYSVKYSLFSKGEPGAIALSARCEPTRGDIHTLRINKTFQNCKYAEVVPEMGASPALGQQYPAGLDCDFDNAPIQIALFHYWHLFANDVASY